MEETKKKEVTQADVIKFVTSAMKFVRGNVPNEIGLIRAYEKVIADLRSFEY